MMRVASREDELFASVIFFRSISTIRKTLTNQSLPNHHQGDTCVLGGGWEGDQHNGVTMIQLLDVRIAEGIRPIIFGMTVSEVTGMLGNPDKRHTSDLGNVHLRYNDYKIDLQFDLEQAGRLGWIATSDPKSRVGDYDPWGLAQDVVTKYFTDVLSEAPNIEDYISFESVVFDSVELELQFEYGTLRTIGFGHLWLDDEPVYPEVDQ